MSENLYVELSDRSKQIFKSVVETYLETGSPSGSETILKKGGVDLSSSSIRLILRVNFILSATIKVFVPVDVIDVTALKRILRIITKKTFCLFNGESAPVGH